MDKPNIETLIDECRSVNPARQVHAVQALLGLEAPEAIPALTNLLTSPDPAVRSTAARALGILGLKQYEALGSALSNLINDKEAIVRAEAVDSLGVLRYTPAFEAIRVLLHKDPEPLVRAAAAETLGDLGNANALADLERALRDPDEAVRAYAANSIGLLGTSEFLPTLKTYIESEASPRVKAELYGAGCRLGAEEDCNSLVAMLETVNEDLPINILNILADLTERRVPAALSVITPRLRTILLATTQRIPILSGDIERVITRLLTLETKPPS